MNFISKEASQRIREEYPVGARVELTKMSDPYRTDLVPGCRGTVRFVDDMGTIHVSWDLLPARRTTARIFNGCLLNVAKAPFKRSLPSQSAALRGIRSRSSPRCVN